MTETELDFARISGPIPEGTYPFKVVDVREELGPSGYVFWSMRFECLQKGVELGKAVFSIFSHSPGARFKIEELLNAVGAPEEGKAKKNFFLGKQLRIVVVHKEWEGNTQANIGNMLPMGGAVSTDTKVTVPELSDDVEIPF